MIISAGSIESFEFAKPVGVGLIESAMNLTKLLLYCSESSLTFIGSAGSYTKKREIFEIFHSKSASNIELSFLDSNSYSPIDNLISIEKPQNIVNSSNYITQNFELAQNFLKYNIEFENMEFFSILRVAKEFNIDVTGIFIVTNYCNESAHSDFLANHKEAMKRLTKYVEENLR